MASDQWYYVRDGARIGPVRGDEVYRLLGTGEITSDTLVWREGMDDWERARRHFDGGTPPPVPGSGFRPGGGRSESPAWPSPPANAQIGPDGLYVGAPARGFGEAISVCFGKYFTFSGRASRSEHWYFVLFTVLLGIVTGIVDSALFGVSFDGDDIGPVNLIATLVVLFPYLAVTWRRLHDTDRSGWWIGAAMLASIALAPVLFVMGTQGGLGGVMAGLTLFGIAALIYGVVILVFLCTRGTPGPNRFG